MSVCDELLMEFREELKTTRRVLDRVPGDKLNWKPHEKSMCLGALALHIAGIPGAIAGMVAGESFDLLKADFTPRVPKSTDEICAALDQSAIQAENAFKSATEETAYAQWRLMKGDTVMMALPRVVAWRTLLLNHWYHHRGQLSVYLRLLDVPVPSVYGPTADEKVFG